MANDYNLLPTPGEMQWVDPRHVLGTPSDDVARPWNVVPGEEEQLARALHDVIIRPNATPKLTSVTTATFDQKLGQVVLMFENRETAASRLPLTPLNEVFPREEEPTWTMTGVSLRLGIIAVAKEQSDGAIQARIVPLHDRKLQLIIESMMRP